MRYQPLNGDMALEKDSFISPNWTVEELNMVVQARRVIGFGGAFPPYQGLLDKFMKANGFHEAFELRQNKGLSSRPKARRSTGEGFELKEFAWDLIHMGRDHEFPTHALKGESSVNTAHS